MSKFFPAITIVLASVSFSTLAASKAQVIKVTLTDTAVTLDVAQVKPGKVTFEVTNSKDSKADHEMVVLRTDLAQDKLPVKGAEVEEGKLKNLGEAHDMKPGVVKRLSLKLGAGHYVLICNIPGHYAMGMHTSLTVAP